MMCIDMGGERTQGDVALVCMPFYLVQSPPIAAGLLRAILQRRGISCDLHHFNLQLADSDPVGYDKISSAIFFHGEWVFSHQLYDRPVPATLDEVVAALNRMTILSRAEDEPPAPKLPVANIRDRPDGYAQVVFEFLQRAGEFMDACVDGVDWGRYRVVGFTSTFQQNVASLALAKRLKARFPHLYIAFGGGNCDGELGETLFDTFEFIDGVCTGEGDVVFPELVEGLLAGAPAEPRAGFLDRRCPPRRSVLPMVGGRQPRTAKQPYVDLDSLPVPDFGPYFEQRAQTRLDRESMVIPFETSRGCWWGQKQHCTFCGINGGNMQYRRKSADVALAEICELKRRYGHHTENFSATDNILPIEYPRQLLPRLIEADLGLHLFYEVKSNLKRRELVQMRDAGIKTIQPGIEALSTPILKLMNKGVTGLQNIRLLKFGRQYGIKVHWNALYGFPSEDAEDYDGQPELWDKLHHLNPPMNCAPIRIDRFSPFHERPQAYGIENLRPHSAYARVYPDMTPAQLAGTAYIFVGDYESQAWFCSYAEELCAATQRWKLASARAAMVWLDGDAGLAIGKFGWTSGDSTWLLEREQRALYLACDDIRSAAYLRDHLQAARGRPVGEAELQRTLAPLLDAGLMLQEGDRYLGLAVSLADDYFLPLEHWDQLGRLAMIANGTMAADSPGSPIGDAPPARQAAVAGAPAP